MNGNANGSDRQDRRIEPREALERFYSVEMNIGGPYSAYQFKLRNISDTGLCILVREDSSVLDNITVGDVYKVRFYQDGDPTPARNAMAEVRHLTHQTEGRYQGHYLVGLIIKTDTGAEQS